MRIKLSAHPYVATRGGHIELSYQGAYRMFLLLWPNLEKNQFAITNLANNKVVVIV